MIEFLSSISVVGWVLIIAFLACLRYLPVLLRDMFVPDRTPRKHVPGEEPPIFHRPPDDHGQG